MIKSRLISIALLLLCTFSLKASVHSENHEIKNFIPNNIDIENQNWNICQHPVSGFMYFANSEGLIEYDGLTSTTYHMPYNKVVRSVYIDRKGNIYTGGFEDFGFWQQTASCGLAFNSLSKKTQIEKNDEIWKIYEQDGRIFFQSFTSIYIYDGNKIKKVKGPFTQLFMFPKARGFFVQILENGLYTFENEKYAPVPGGNIFANIKIHTIVPYKKDKYLIGTANNGLYIYDGKAIRPFACEVSDFLKYNTCNAGIAINDSLFVFGTILNGIVEFSAAGKIKMIYNYTNGLKNNTVLSLYKDFNQGLWIGLDQGTNFLDVLSPIAQYTNVTGSLGTIYTILERQNTLYIGTNQGLFTARITNRSGNFSFSDIRIVPGSQGQVWTLREFANQVLCGHNEGTFLVEKEKLKKISNITGGWAIKPLGQYLVEGTYTGLALFMQDARGAWTLRNKIEGFGEPSRHIEVDYMGYVWVSHQQRGIYRIELDDQFKKAKNILTFKDIGGSSENLDVFKLNNRIVFTGSDKLYTFDYDAGKIIPFETLNRQLNEFSKAALILPYERNQYWFVYENKLALFEIGLDFRARKILELNQSNIHSPGNDLELIKMDTDHILFPNHKGFIVFNTLMPRFISEVSKLMINRIRFQGKGKTRTVCGNSAEIKVPYQLNNITFYISDPGRFNMDQKIYYYRIPEVEDQWHTTGVNNFNYNNMRFGTYILETKADINAPVVTQKFTIRSPWYLTKLAFTGYAILFLLLNYLAFLFFRYELRKQKKLVEMEVRRNTLENELDVKSNELMLTMRYLIQKNEILTELKEEIDALKEQSAKYPVKPIKNLEKIIYQGLDMQTESWKSAMNNLKLSEQGFFRRLKEKHPDLTPNDLRLCSYLRMNFTTKEIAHLLNISGRGVEIGRYRLRKKMNLPHDVNLSEYLMEN